MRRVMPLLLAALAGLGVLASSSPAGRERAASCTPVNSVGTTSFHYVLCGLPDLDQIRENTTSHVGLPGDGYAFCAPTSTMDALAWFASHGVPSLRPGNKHWTLAANYDEMTKDIADLGSLMGTTASGGTTTGYFTGLNQWLTETVGGLPQVLLGLVVPSYLWVTAPNVFNFAPTLMQMAQDAAAGSLVIPNVQFAKFELPPSPQTGPKQWYVVGGHVLAMSFAKSPDTIGWSDPYLPTLDDTVQSPYSQDKYTLTPVTSTFGYLNTTTNANQNFKATILRVDNYSVAHVFGTGVQGYLWGYSVLSPETVTGWSGFKVTLVAPVKPGDPVETFTSEGERAVVDLVLDPSGPRDFYVEQGASTVWALNTANGRSTPFASVSSPRLLGFAGRTQTLFVAGAQGLTAIRGRRASKNTVAHVSLREHVDALTVDQETSRVFALSAESGQLHVFNSRLRPVATVQVPAGALAGSGRVSMTLRGNALYVHRDGRPAIALFALRGSKVAGARFVRLAGAVRPTGLAVDDAGHIFVQSDSRLAEYSATGKELSTDFTAKVAGSALVVNRAFSNAPLSSLPFRDSPLPRRRR